MKTGDKTRKAINSQRAAAKRQGYFEHAERLRKGIELYDQWKAEQAETEALMDAEVEVATDCGCGCGRSKK